MKTLLIAWYNSLTEAVLWKMLGKYLVAVPIIVVCVHLFDSFIISLIVFFAYYFISSRFDFFAYINFALWIVGLIMMIASGMHVAVIVVYIFLFLLILGRVIFHKQ